MLGLKKEMTVRFSKLGYRIPVTTIMASPNVVLTKHNDKVQLGLGQKKKVKKTENAYVKVAGFTPRFIREVPIEKPKVAQESAEQSRDYSPGDTVSVSIFTPGDLVKVIGTTRGKGFMGVVKRWGFAGGPKTHGQSDRHRAPGSIGQTTTPGRVFKGKKMAGHMGVSQLTVRNLEVIEVDPSNDLLVVKGSVPGSRNGLLVIEKIGHAKAQTAQPSAKEDKKEEEEKVVAKEPANAAN